MAIKLVVLFAFVAVCLARSDGPPYGYRSGHQPEYEGPAKYDFDWSVSDAESENNFGQQESRDGEDTEGSYYVLLPDGRTQKVTYTVNGDSGFVADVTYEGEARYEQTQAYKPKPQAYQPKPQTYQPQPQAYQPQAYQPPPHAHNPQPYKSHPAYN